MRPEDKIMQGSSVWSRVYRRRFEMCAFIFMLAAILTAVISALIPHEDKYVSPVFLHGMMGGICALLLTVLTYLGWWMWVALFDKDVTE